MNLQEMLGDSFHEGMTIDEINTALSGKKFADLSTGQYVDANKYKADIASKNAELAKKQEEINSKLTADEKTQADIKADKDRIKQLEQQIEQQRVSSNVDGVKALTSSVLSTLEIKNDDVDYNAMVDVLSKIDSDNARKTATYINKLVKDAYEKGKTDADKNNLGGFGAGVGKPSTSGSVVGKFGADLAKEMTSSNVDPEYYFKKN